MSASESPTSTGLGSDDDVSFVDLGKYCNHEYDPGRGMAVRTLWYYVSQLFFENGWFPFNGLKTGLLRFFGARMGTGYRIKPHIRIKYPWRLSMGEHCWIGQEVWIDNLADVELGSHVCVSQRVYLCTGGHDYRSPEFKLIVTPIQIGNGVWLGAASLIFGGITVAANAVVAGGSIVTKDISSAAIVGGNPAKPIGRRCDDNKLESPP